MNKLLEDLQLKIGLEIHAQISTKTKLFSRALNEKCNDPNRNITLFDIAVPGILPKLNSNAVFLAVKSGLALNCNINKISKFDRKHYQYADLPFGYQITQFFHPICENGYLEIGPHKKIRINRIHMECDAGKMIHTSKGSLLDYNRVGVPLMEIVTEPDLNSAQEVESFLKELILILEYMETCQCNMESGNLRVDVNISLNDNGKYGRRVELKNMNSIKFIREAIAAECDRQLEEINNNTYEKNVVQETRGYDSEKKSTYGMRLKETPAQYRYMPDGNIPKLVLTDEYIENVKSSMEILPQAKRSMYNSYLPQNIAEAFVNNHELGKMYDKLEPGVENKQLFANFILGDILGIVNHNNLNLQYKFLEIALKLTNLLHENRITTKTAKLILEECILNDLDPEATIQERNLYKLTDANIITSMLEDIIKSKQKLWEDFRKGNEKLLMVFLGDIIKQTNGQADADITKNIILNYKLKQ